MVNWKETLNISTIQIRVVYSRYKNENKLRFNLLLELAFWIEEEIFRK